MNKRGLGRGLGALLSSTPGEEEAIAEIAIDQIDVNPNQPRKLFDSAALDELATSIKTSGVIQPVVVRRHPPLAIVVGAVRLPGRPAAPHSAAFREARHQGITRPAFSATARS